jgi:hypothetical protein
MKQHRDNKPHLLFHGTQSTVNAALCCDNKLNLNTKNQTRCNCTLLAPAKSYKGLNTLTLSIKQPPFRGQPAPITTTIK